MRGFNCVISASQGLLAPGLIADRRLIWEQVRLVRDRWPRVDTFFHRLTCEGIKIPHPRFYRHRGMSRGMFHPPGKSAVTVWKEQCIVWCGKRA